MNAERLQSELTTLPEAAEWPEMAGVFARTGAEPRLDWDLPRLACLAVGGHEAQAVAGCAAIACLQISIILVDDILDNDPRGEYHTLGAGRASNLALAFQAAAFRLVGQAPVPAIQKNAASASLAWAAHATSLGQELDVQNLKGETNYWKVIRAKSTPFYGAALEVGALLGGASPDVAGGLRDVGILLGEIIQLHDDLVDAFESPANPDWKEGRNNLLVLYARTADHPQRAQLESLLPQIDDPAVLRQAHQILIQSGAVSYCGYQLLLRHREARAWLHRLSLPSPAPLTKVLTDHTLPLLHLLQTNGAKVPPELLEVAA
jgi:geranylgeranyl pyrophosphate synthase